MKTVIISFMARVEDNWTPADSNLEAPADASNRLLWYSQWSDILIPDIPDKYRVGIVDILVKEK